MESSSWTKEVISSALSCHPAAVGCTLRRNISLVAASGLSAMASKKLGWIGTRSARQANSWQLYIYIAESWTNGLFLERLGYGGSGECRVLEKRSVSWRFGWESIGPMMAWEKIFAVPKRNDSNPASCQLSSLAFDIGRSDCQVVLKRPSFEISNASTSGPGYMDHMEPK